VGLGAWSPLSARPRANGRGRSDSVPRTSACTDIAPLACTTRAGWRQCAGADTVTDEKTLLSRRATQKRRRIERMVARLSSPSGASQPAAKGTPMDRGCGLRGGSTGLGGAPRCLLRCGRAQANLLRSSGSRLYSDGCPERRQGVSCLSIVRRHLPCLGPRRISRLAYSQRLLQPRSGRLSVSSSELDRFAR